MCLEIAGSVIANGSASSLTLASPLASRAKIARRVGIGERGEGLVEPVLRQRQSHDVSLVNRYPY